MALRGSMGALLVTHNRWRWLQKIPYTSHSDAGIPHYDSRKMKVSYSRSSGPGGQNVNKVETQVELRIRPEDVEISADAVSRLRDLCRNRMSANGEMMFKSSETRSQKQNFDIAARLASDYIRKAMIEPKVWNKNSKTKNQFKAKRMQEKKHQSKLVAWRRGDR
mmetsp:Transcript_4416/g.18782  ORF Transcript_4416/g.18782 Transcript_4416/m.18782 type:complete len:164 (-) Transcript_4416:5888-6379(-)